MKSERHTSLLFHLSKQVDVAKPDVHRVEMYILNNI